MVSVTSSSGEVTPAEIERQLTERQLQVLQYLLKKAMPLKVYTVYADQDELALV